MKIGLQISQIGFVILLISTLLILVVVLIMSCVMLLLAYPVCKPITHKYIHPFYKSQPSTKSVRKSWFLTDPSVQTGARSVFLTANNRLSPKHFTGDQPNVTKSTPFGH